jgi:hypothetical protein
LIPEKPGFCTRLPHFLFAERSQRRVMPRFDYDSLAACLDTLGLQDEAAAPASVTALLWQARLDFDIVQSSIASPVERAEATRRLALLVRLMNDPAASAEALTKRRPILIAAGKEAGVPDLHNRLRQLAEDIGTAALASPEPAETFKNILHPASRGRPTRGLDQRIARAAAVERLLVGGMTLAKACHEVASSEGGNVTPDAIRKDHDKAMESKSGAALVRLVAAGDIEL